MAQDLSLPQGADRTFRSTQNPGRYAAPVAPWTSAAGLQVETIEGQIQLEAWRIKGVSQSPFQIAQALRDTLNDAGFDVVLDCSSRSCGGFDFRFSTLVLPAPEMFVDLTEFHFVTAKSAERGVVTLLASRDSSFSYVQIIRAGAVASGMTKPTGQPAQQPVSSRPLAPVGDLIGQLEQFGHAILDDLIFQSGSSSLGNDSYQSLDALVSYLGQNPDKRILLVGHTDATGSLEANKSVSLQRARAAKKYLLAKGLEDKQISAQGAGYLSPVASNLTDEGRTANRRIEAVVLPAQ